MTRCGADEGANRRPGRVAFDSLWSRGQIGFTDFAEVSEKQSCHRRRNAGAPPSGSKRKTLHVAAHASHIVGWPVPEGRLLLRDLTEFATQREFVYRHAGGSATW